MNIQWLLLLVTFAMAEKQIKLEDIERDNLISERRANREQEQLATGQTQQHLRTPSGASYEVAFVFENKPQNNVFSFFF